MRKIFEEIQVKLLKKQIKTVDHRFNDIIHNYALLYLSSETKMNFNNKLIQNLKESNTLMINYLFIPDQETEEKFYIIGFKKTIIIIEPNCLSSLHNLFALNQNLAICFLSNCKNAFNEEIHIKYNEIEKNLQFSTEIKNFNQHLFLQIPLQSPLNRIWTFIIPCISGFLIKQSYSKQNKDRVTKFLNSTKDEKFQSENFSEKEYITLRLIGRGCSFDADLIYHIEREELFVVKTPNSITKETEKIINREFQNYSKLHHPFLPKFIGTVKDKGHLVIEFINGKTLINARDIPLNDNDKITIIFELMITIVYLHFCDFIYRDLKPDNIIIDENNDIVIIDFDRMIFANNELNNEKRTNGFASSYLAPEVLTDNFTYKCDIYSLGHVIHYIMNINNVNGSDVFGPYKTIKSMYYKCIEKDPNKRPSLLILIFDFFIYYYSKIKITSYNNFLIDFFKRYYGDEVSNAITNYVLKPNDGKSLYDIGLVFEGMNCWFRAFSFYTNALNNNYKKAKEKIDKVSQIISKNITLNFDDLQDENDPKKNYLIGCFYYLRKDMEKAIHFLTLATEKNYPDGYLILCVIYAEGNGVPVNMKKCLHYLSLSANSNILIAQRKLAILNFNGQYVPKDRSKAFYYFQLAAGQNDSISQYFLGLIYSDKQFDRYDINKAIYYYTLAADQNFSMAQYQLGMLYLKGTDIPMNKNKGLHYLFLAAANNNTRSLFSLGFFYLCGYYVERDINKGFQYMLESANLDYPYAQCVVGMFYVFGVNIKCDPKKGIYYLTRSLNNGFSNVYSHYTLGVLYHQGLFVQRDIMQAIYFYKQASSFNNKQAKNNLGVIYKNGYENEIEINIPLAMTYFNEAIYKTNDTLSLFNLANIYFYNEPVENSIDKAIELLIKAFDSGFYHSKQLLCLASIVRFDFDLENIREQLDILTNNRINISNAICQMIKDENIIDISVFEEKYNKYCDASYLYLCNDVVISLSLLMKFKHADVKQETNPIKEINDTFYKGFDIDFK